MRLLTVLFILSYSYLAHAGCIQADQISNEIQKIKDVRAKSNLTTKPFTEKSYPSVKFVDADLPRFWLGPEFTELVGEAHQDGKSFYQSLCTKTKDNSCKQWCILRSDSPQFYQSNAKQEALDRCEKCQQGGSCENIQLLKNSSDSISMNTYEKKPVILQMASDGRLLIFQTTDGKKDLKKPYVELNLTSDGNRTSQKLSVVGSPQGSASVQSNFTSTSDVGYYGFRVCELMMMSVDNCSTQVPSVKNSGLSYSCTPTAPAKGSGSGTKATPAGKAN